MSSGSMRVKRKSRFLLWFFLLATVSVGYAIETEELRLFYDVADTGNELIDQAQERLQASTSQTAASSAAKSPVMIKKTSYRYDGFVSSAEGYHYLINGRTLDTYESLSFVSASQDGSVVEIKDKKGRVMQLTIGGTVNEVL